MRVVIIGLGIAITPTLAGAEEGGGITYSLSVGGTYTMGNLISNSGTYGGTGLMVDSDIGFTVGDRGGLALFARFDAFDTSVAFSEVSPRGSVEDGQLGLRGFLILRERVRVSLGAGLLGHHLATSDGRTSALEFGAVFQTGAAYEVARTGEFSFELGGDISVAAHSQSGPGAAAMAEIALWFGVRHLQVD